jgi:hypothetical protein
MDIRLETENDWSAIYDLNVLAFETQVEADLVNSLRKCAAPYISLVATIEDEVAGHILGELIYSIGQYIALAHAARICEAEGVQLDQFATIFKAGEPAHDLADMVHSDNYEVGAIHPGASVNTWEGCIKLIQDHARLGILNCEIPDFYSNLFNRAIDSGYGEEDVASIVKVLRQNAKPV